VGDVFSITLFTLGVALLSTVLILPGGVALGWLLARRRWPGKALVETLVALPLVVPPVATGLVLLKLFGRRGMIGAFLENTLGFPVVFTWKAVVLATAVMSFPLLVRTARVAFEEVDARLEQAARTLGASPWRVFWRVTLPLVGPALRRGMAFAAATAVGEFAVTLFLSRPEWTTLSTLIYRHLGRPGAANLDAAMVLATLLMALALLAFVAIDPPERHKAHA